MDTKRGQPPSMKRLLLMGYHHTPKHHRKYILCHAICFSFLFLIYYSLNGGIIPWFLTSHGVANLGPGGSLVDHFPETYGDGSKIKWAHETNKKHILVRAIEDPTVMMIEGDVILKGQNTKQQQLLPVMVQEGFAEDFEFTDWLNMVLDSSKGIKVNFKTIEPMEICLQKMQIKMSQIKKAVHLSADIVEGPNSALSQYKPVDPQRFLRLVSSYFPQGTLVVGWTTGTAEHGYYTWDMVKEMYDVVSSRKIKQPVSISVHAHYIRHSLCQLKWLSEMLESTVTVVSSKEEMLNDGDLLFVRHKFPKDSVYYDMHHVNVADIDANMEGAKEIAAQLAVLDQTVRSDQWDVKKEAGSRIYLGTEALVIHKGLVINHEDPYVFTNEPLKLKGNLEFFDIPLEAESQKDIGVSIFLHADSIAKSSDISGIRIFIGLHGHIEISTHGMGEIHHRSTAVEIEGDSPCFTFSITETLEKSVVVDINRPVQCFDAGKDVPKAFSGTAKLMGLEDIKFRHKQIAILAENKHGFVAIESFVISS